MVDYDDIDDDQAQDPVAEAAKSREPKSSRNWLKLISEAETVYETWQFKADSVDKLYANLERLANIGRDREFQLFWSNVSVLAPAIYSRPPVPVVIPRFKDRRALPRQASELQVGGVTQGIEKQRADGMQKHIEDWAGSRPAFELYAPHIATEIREGAANLDEAEQRVFQKYPQLAELAKQAAAKLAADETPAKPDASSAPAAAAAAALSAQTEKGSKSITGAPTGGSEPAKRQPSNSIKEALKRAAARAG